MRSIKRDGLRKFVDLCMLILLLCLMSYQVTGEEKHEWTGILMTLTAIVHQILNRRWYAALFKGRYNFYRSVTTAVNVLLLASMLVTAFCGMSMSEYAVPFLYWARWLIFVRPTHLAMSHWSFVLMGLHLGLHIPLMLGRTEDRTRTILTAFGTVIGGVGFWLFLRNGMPNYLFFRVPFAFLDYEKAFWLVFLENALMLSTWAFLGAELAVWCMRRKNRKPALILGSIAAATVLGLVLNTAFPGDNDLDFDAEKRVYLLTGANRGGKTTVTQAVGQLMLLAQGGIYVPAEGFRFTPADGIYTHFPADEDRTLDLGRLGEECKRFRELFEKCTESSLLLLNETFSTTSFEEGYYIAADAIRAILSRGTRTIYNTHMHKLAKELEQFNREDGKAKAVSLIVRSEGGKRSFRVEIAPPEGTSLARDIAEKYGVTYEALTGTAEERN